MSRKPVILIDVGNTSTAIGIRIGDRIMHVSRVDTEKCTVKMARNVIKSVSKGKNISGAAICSVVPKINRMWKSEILDICSVKLLTVSYKMNLSVKIDYPKPASIGPDRLANACGAVARYGAPVIVADFGTALTFDVISPDMKYIGGVIAPGLPLMTDYLADKTALLPHIKLGGNYGKIGRSTEGAMRIGAKIGYRGIVREIVQYIEKELGYKNVNLCATGGYAEWALGDINMPFKFDPDLTLFGLSEIFNINKEKS